MKNFKNFMKNFMKNLKNSLIFSLIFLFPRESKKRKLIAKYLSSFLSYSVALMTDHISEISPCGSKIRTRNTKLFNVHILCFKNVRIWVYYIQVINMIFQHTLVHTSCTEVLGKLLTGFDFCVSVAHVYKDDYHVYLKVTLS